MTRLFALALAAVLVAPPLVFAHEGHAHKVMGTVSTIHENHLEVKTKDGKVSTHVLDPKTKILRGKAAAKLADIKPGDRVVVTFVQSKDKAGKEIVSVTQVDLGTRVATTQK
ncbi:MAG TPA: hypothetical protein VEK56_00985 [Vicinamibacterales bacterium]|nr:hypothetical protein [Vicinamibacterales bacterium]